MASGQDKHLAQLTAALLAHGVSEKIASQIAAGTVLTLRQWCWANLTDVVGAAEDVDELAQSVLPPLVLADALHQLGFLGLEHGRYFLPSAWTDRPVYIERRWQRKNPDSFAEARRRSKLVEKILLPAPEMEVHFPKDLFGDAIPEAMAPQTTPESTQRRHDGTPGHRELVAYWCERWTATDGAGGKYPFKRGRDGQHIKDLIKATDDIDAAKRIIDAYLANRERFFTGHKLGKLIGDLPRFLVAAHGTIPGSLEIQDPGGRELPDL